MKYTKGLFVLFLLVLISASVHAQGGLTYTTFDNFNDGDYTNNPTWTALTGGWSAASFYLYNGTQDTRIVVGKSALHNANISTEKYGWKWDAYATGGESIAFLLTNDSANNSNHSWAVYMRGDGTCAIFKNNYGTSKYDGACGSSSATFHTLEMTRDTNGDWKFYLDDSLFTSFNDTDGTTNNYYKVIHSGSNADCRVDNIEVGVISADVNPFTLSVDTPTLGDYVNQTIDINFTLTDVNADDDPRIKLYYSATSGAYENLIYSDTNLSDGAGITCASYDFTAPKVCTYSWNANAIADGNYFIDANVITQAEDWNTLASGGEFMKETIAPTTFATASQISGYTISNIDITCSDTNSGCNRVYYRFNSGAWTDTNVLPIDVNYSGAGTHTLQFYGVDLAGNIEDTNSISFTTTADTTPPTIDFDVNIVNVGFVNDFNVGLILTCWDNRLDDLNFIITKTTNGTTTTILNVQDVNGTTKTIYNTLSVGSNLFTGRCIDFNGNSISQDSNTIYAMAFRLINEETGAALTDLNVIDVATLQAFTYDGNNVYDYNIFAPTTKLFIDFDNVVRFDLTYNDVSETKLSREIDFGLLPDTNVGLCVAPFQNFYEQFFVSSGNKDVVVFNDFANCYNLASSTKFAYENALMVRAFTINKPYYLYTWIDDVKTLLATIDGSKASVINLDVLEFNKETYSFDIATDTVVFKCLENTTTGVCDQNTIAIYYKSLRGDNESVNYKIYKANTLLWEYTEEDEPNEFNTNFVYAALDVNTDDVLKLIITKTSTAGVSASTDYWFNLRGQQFSGTMDASLALIFSFLLLFVGLTLVAYRYAFGWFGIMLCVVAVGILSFAPGFWYVQFMQAVIVIVAVFITIVFANETKGVN